MSILTDLEKNSIAPKVKDMLSDGVAIDNMQKLLLYKGISISLSRLEWIVAMIKYPHIANYSFLTIQ